MKVKNIIAEDFVNYKEPSLFIVSSICDFKCCKEQNIDISICQNQEIIHQPTIDISNRKIYNMYKNNPITHAIVIGGLEPMLQLDEVIDLIAYFRNHGCDDNFIIYTGYNKDEIGIELKHLSQYKNIIIKFGRYIPNQSSHYDDVLGVDLISDNQYAERIS